MRMISLFRCTYTGILAIKLSGGACLPRLELLARSSLRILAVVT